VLRGAETDRRESRFAATDRQRDRRDGGAGRDDHQARLAKAAFADKLGFTPARRATLEAAVVPRAETTHVTERMRV